MVIYLDVSLTVKDTDDYNRVDLKDYVNHFTNDFEFAKMESDIAHCGQTGNTIISDDGCLLSLAVESGLAFG